MAYIASARHLAQILNTKKKFYKAFLKEFNRIGHEYFDSCRSGYAAPSKDADQMPIQVLTKKEFAKVKREYEWGSNNEEAHPNDEIIFHDEASFDDAYRHAVLVDTQALPNIVAVPIESLADGTIDHVFTWAQVDAFVKAHPDGRYVIVHGDTIGPQFFLPIPTPLNLFDPATLKEMGFNTRKRKQKQRKTRKNTHTF